MNVKKMLHLCKLARAILHKLEGLMAYLPDEHDATQFVYMSLQDVRELVHIARHETICNVTVAQASHIHEILSRAAFYLDLVPQRIKDLDD